MRPHEVCQWHLLIIYDEDRSPLPRETTKTPSCHPADVPQGDFCINCGAPFIRSFVTFEHLPLVEFELNSDITDEEAAKLLGEDAGVDTRYGKDLLDSSIHHRLHNKLLCSISCACMRVEFRKFSCQTGHQLAIWGTAAAVPMSSDWTRMI